MTDYTKIDPAMQIAPEQLAALLGSRLCHDLVSPLGAIGNGVELLQLSAPPSGLADTPEMSLISQSVAAARNRINVFRIAFGSSMSTQRIAASELATLIQNIQDAGRLKIDLAIQNDQARNIVKLILLGLMCLETAMPWGGRVLVCEGQDGRWRLVAEAERVKQDPALWSWLTADAIQSRPDLPPSDVHFALMSLGAKADQRRLEWELDAKGGEISF